MIVKKYHDTHCEDKEVLFTIKKAIDASPELRSKKQLFETFIAGINDADWGEVPQYYVGNNHEAIIDPTTFDLVQAEIMKRTKGKNRYSGVGLFASKFKCGQCGSWYGAKVWHSNDK